MKQKVAERFQLIQKSRRIVVKVGTKVLTAGTRRISRRVVHGLAEDLLQLRKGGREVVLVSSGAIAAGSERLRLKEYPRTIPGEQAAAAVGQCHLMDLYMEAFARHRVKVGQILLTHADFSNRSRFLNARGATLTLLEQGILPIVNENDTVSVEEIKFGDNDNLAALFTSLVGADLLVILSDIDGIYSADPRREKGAELIPLLNMNQEIASVAGEYRDSPLGKGGIQSKLEAADKAARFGVPAVIANGRKKGTLPRIMKGEEVGTFCLPKPGRLKSRKSWIAFHLKASGALVVDSGAEAALTDRGKSLLPSGIIAVEGEFEIGNSVRILDEKHREFARGLVAYSSGEIRKIMGHKTTGISRILGYKYYDEVIHRDDLVVI